ncbi:phage antirepressor [Lactococcus petauri]|jgi:anti-repressor protein|uniref:phage antirepressor n=1 Tax=Lactococcus petauri TaxID=1940789 RepID=UPI0018AB6AC9|nr:phage antirepressor KilAC domain-containing protein [Lactococcus petauri]MDC0808963.1 phage antirepressor KilAC domain-containing protein [Lactococcus petauri]MDC0812818.1 phage antirepressor KilAC domain-containing protein [Lactococcus petauri]
MNQLQNFNFNNLQVRTVLIGNEPWFVAKDVSDILEYSDTQAMTRRLDTEDIKSYTDKSSGQGRQVKIINESGLYEAIIGSKKKDARKFKRWITHEVLPTIRKHGAYMTDSKAQDVLNGSGLADLLLQAGQQLKEKELIITEMKPKALFADSVATSQSSILVGHLAKLLRQNGYEIGQNRLFERLRNQSWLSNRKGEDWNMPTQKSLDRGFFEIKETTHNNADGSVRITKTPKVTGKGQIYFVNKFLQELEA